MKKRVAVLLTTGLFIPMFSGIHPVFADTPYVLSTKKYNEVLHSPEFVAGKLTEPSKKSPEEVVFEYLNTMKQDYKLGNKTAEESFKVEKVVDSSVGDTKVVRLKQVYNDVPVWGSTQVVHVGKDGVLQVVTGKVMPDLEKQEKLQNKNRIDSQKAVELVQQDLGFQPTYSVQPSADLYVYQKDNSITYAYVVQFTVSAPNPGKYYYFIEADSGNILDKYHTAQHFQGDTNEKNNKSPLRSNVENIEKHNDTSNDSEDHPDQVVGENTIGRGTGVLGDSKIIQTTKVGSKYYLQDNTRGAKILTYDGKKQLFAWLWKDDDNMFHQTYDAAAVDAHFYAGVVYDYYKNKHNRNSYDNAESPIKSLVHPHPLIDNNAGWGDEKLEYGDGDDTKTRAYSGSLNVVGHEFTHGVTQTSSNLMYRNESGALNEAISDLFGTLIEHEYYSKHSNQKKANWDHGEDLYIDGKTVKRSLRDPASISLSEPMIDKDGKAHTKYPDHYSKLYNGSQDEGGVHVNSSIINKATYLLANGGTHYGVTVKGIGKDKVGKIYYLANTEMFTEYTGFHLARAGLEQATAKLYGVNSEEVKAVKAAYDAVGIYAKESHVPPTENKPTDTTAPSAPTVHNLTDAATEVSGTGEPGAKVTVTANGKPIGTGTVEEDGHYTVGISKQVTGTEIKVTLTDGAGNVSEPTKTQVKTNVASQDQLVEGIKQEIEQLFTNSVQAQYTHNFTTEKKQALQVHVTQKYMTELEERIHAISDERKEKVTFQQEMERAKKLLTEREKGQAGNLIKNGLFDAGLDNWKTWAGSGAKKPEVQRDGGKSENVIKVDPNSSIEQVVTGLEPNTSYEFTLYAKTENGERLSVGVKNTGTANVSAAISSNEYNQATLRFKTGLNATTATVYVYKSSGTKPGYADLFIAKKLMDK
ncbi:TPA: M4 family metallopeptidase [Bacillus cereus]|nr:M4 family metallopeptidase [Bacillus cereus]